jgi:Flp pilus assembly protein TadG
VFAPRLSMRSSRRFVLNEPTNGQITPALALISIVLLGMAALSIDVFMMYWTNGNLQRATDAAAVAGATYLADSSFSGANGACTYSTPAQQAACTYALSNGVLASEILSIVIAGDSRSITVTTSRQSPAFFARLFGFTQFTVNATATGGIQPIGSANDLMPIGLDSSTSYQYGQPILMHNANCGPGCWGGVDYAGNGSSGSQFDAELASGCGCRVNAGSAYNSIPGSKVGNVSKGISDRIGAGNSSDPSGTWQSHQLTNARATAVGLVTWGSSGGSTQTATVQGFAEVWVTDSSQPDFPAACSGMSKTDICAIFLRQIVPGGLGTGSVDAGAMRARLLS